MHIDELYHEQGSFTLSIKNQIIGSPGQCTAVIGENGAGKSTLFRILSGALKPNKIIWSEKNIRKVLFHDAFATLNPRLRVIDHLTWSASMHGASHLFIKKVSDDFDLATLFKRYPSSLSAGQMTRLRLAKTLLAEPDVILLDEPTTGLQFSAAEQVVSCISILLKQGKSVVVSTHHLIELSGLKPFLIGLKDGRVILSENWSLKYEHYNQVCELMRSLAGHDTGNIFAGGEVVQNGSI